MGMSWEVRNYFSMQKIIWNGFCLCLFAPHGVSLVLGNMATAKRHLRSWHYMHVIDGYKENRSSCYICNAKTVLSNLFFR